MGGGHGRPQNVISDPVHKPGPVPAVPTDDVEEPGRYRAVFRVYSRMVHYVVFVDRHGIHTGIAWTELPLFVGSPQRITFKGPRIEVSITGENLQAVIPGIGDRRIAAFRVWTAEQGVPPAGEPFIGDITITCIDAPEDEDEQDGMQRTATLNGEAAGRAA